MRSRVVVSEAMRWPRMAWLARTARCAARRWTPLGAVGRADQDAEPGRIDEADLVQVGHERPAAGRQLEQLFPQPGHGDHVNLPDDGHDGVVPFMPGLNGQCLTHGQLPARPESVLGGPGTADITLAIADFSSHAVPAMLPVKPRAAAVAAMSTQPAAAHDFDTRVV